MSSANPIVIRSCGLACGTETLSVGQYLKSYDPEAHGGRGYAEWTDSLADAKLFETHEAAMGFYLSSPESLPTRPDGRPNRPLTAFSVVMERVA